MKTWKKRLAILFIVCMMVSALPTNVQAASKSKIQISKKKLTLNVGKTATLKLKGTKKTPQWTSSKKSVATVTKKGKVKAKKKGSTVITAKLGKKKYNCKVTVKSAAASNTATTASTNTTSTAASNTTSKAPTNTTPPASTNTTPPAVPNTGTQTVAGNYQKLLNYLLYYGKYDYEGEDYYIIDQIEATSANLFTIIEYNLDGSFDFNALLMSDDGTENIITIKITPPEYAKGEVGNIFVYSSGDLLYANGEVVLSSLTTTNQHITYTTTNAETEIVRDSLYALGESMLDLGLQGWSLMLEENNVGLSLKDLGFTSYEG